MMGRLTYRKNKSEQATLRVETSECLPKDGDMRELYDSALCKLADYEDAEENGLLVRLPCKAGDTVWAECWNGYGYAKVISVSYNPYKCGRIMIHYRPFEEDTAFVQCVDQTIRGAWGERVFESSAEAEAALSNQPPNQ